MSMSPACLAGKYHTKSRSAARARTELQQRGNTLLFPTVSSSHIHATHAASPSPHRITAPSRQSSTTTPGTRHRRDRLSYTNTEKHQHGKPGSWRAQRLVTRWTRSSPYLTLQKRRGDFWRTVLRTASAPIMPPSRKCRSSRTNPPVTLQEGRLGQRKRNHCDEQWNARFKELLDYRSEHGNCDIPTRQGKLGTWVNGQRRAYRKKTLAQDRIYRLNSIGFKWKKEQSNVPWKTQFDELVKYKAKHGDCNVPVGQGKLGRWVHKQRTHYKNNNLSKERIHQLNGIGFNWTSSSGCSRKKKAFPSTSEQTSSRQMPWEIRFDKLVQYKAKHGHCDVPQREGPLGRWAHQQRESYKKNKLSQDRVVSTTLASNGRRHCEIPGREKLPSKETFQESSSRQMRVPSPITNVSIRAR